MVQTHRCLMWKLETTSIGGTTSTYGTSKLMAEQIWQDFAKAEPPFSIIALCYFNPVRVLSRLWCCFARGGVPLIISGFARFSAWPINQ
ncbi:UDP-glucose 4-epimerase [Serratia quinivorans]|nr:UDP-glucose 4-epimerase [Serratia quinivorans]